MLSSIKDFREKISKQLDIHKVELSPVTNRYMLENNGVIVISSVHSPRLSVAEGA